MQKNFDSCIYAYACMFANYINHMCGKNWHLNEMLSDMGLMKVESIQQFMVLGVNLYSYLWEKQKITTQGQLDLKSQTGKKMSR